MATFEMTAARAVCRLSNDRVAALDHVVVAISGWLDAVRPWTLETAAAEGLTRLVRRLLQETLGPEPQDIATDKITRAIKAAAARGHLETVKILLKWAPSSKVAPAMELAAGNGHMDVLEWLHKKTSADSPQPRMTLDAMDSAAVNGHLHVIQWLHTNRTEGCTTRALDGAARFGRLEIVQWLHIHRAEGATTQAMDGAAANGHLELLAWLHAHREEGCSSLAVVAARANGHAHVVAWLERMAANHDRPLVAWHKRRHVAVRPAALVVQSAC